jgi:hypothetical protein
LYNIAFELYLSLLLTNTALLEARKAWDSPYRPNSITKCLVLYRYCMSWFTAARCLELGFMLNLANLLIAFTASGHVMTVAYKANPTLFWYSRIICGVAYSLSIAYLIVSIREYE